MWVRVYAWRDSDAGTYYLLYGYALQVSSEDPETPGWRKSGLRGAERLGDVLCFSRFMSEPQVEEFVEQLAGGSATIQLTGGADSAQISFELKSPGLSRRPPVYAYPRSTGLPGPESITGTMSLCESWWVIDKQHLLESIFPPGKWDKSAMEKSLAALLDALGRDTGIDFRGHSPERFGNFDIYRHPIGCYQTPAGVYWTAIREYRDIGCGNKEPYVEAVKFWVDGPIAKCAPLLVNCTLWNGGGAGDGDAAILDEVKEWPSGACEPLVFRAREPVSSVEIRVWEKASGQLLWHDRVPLLRQVHIDVGLVSQEGVVSDPWSQSLGDARLRPIAERVTREALFQRSSTGGHKFDPWVPSARQARRLIDHFIPRRRSGVFFNVRYDDEVASLKFLQKQLSRTDIDRAIIVDPFFSAYAAGKLLARTQNTGVHIDVVTSLTREYDPDTEARKPGSDIPSELVEFLKRNSIVVHRNLRIYNIENKSCSKQQFHDRYLLLYRGTYLADAYMLSNSINKASARYPSVIVTLDSYLAKQVGEYVSGLLGGSVPNHPEARCVKLWDGIEPHLATVGNGAQLTSEQVPDDRRSIDGLQPAGLPQFPGWRLIVDLLGEHPPGDSRQEDDSTFNEKQTPRKLAELVTKGFLCGDKDSGQPESWEVPEESRSEVIEHITSRLSSMIESEPCHVKEAIRALAHWSYNGSGLEGEDTVAAFRGYPLLVDAVREMVRDLAGRRHECPGKAAEADALLELSLSQILETPTSYADSYEDVDRHLDTFFEFAPVIRGAELHFLLPLLWGLDAESYVDILVTQKSAPLLAWLLEAGELGQLKDHLDLLFKSKHPYIRALAGASLWHASVVARFSSSQNRPDSHPYSTERVNSAVDRLLRSPLSREEKLVTLGWWVADAANARPKIAEAKIAATIVRNALVEHWPVASECSGGAALTDCQLQDVLFALAGGRPAFHGADAWNALASDLRPRDPHGAQRIWDEVVDLVVGRLPIRKAEDTPLSADERAVRDFRRRWPELADAQVNFSGSESSDLPRQQMGPEFSHVTDYALTREAAVAAHELHGNGVFSWFEENILRQLQVKRFREPLLRERDYTKWYAICEGLIWAFYLGVEIADLAEPDERKEALTLVRVISGTFEKGLCPDVWVWHDHTGLLREFLLGLGRWADEEHEDDRQLGNFLARLSEDERIPRWRRVFLLLCCCCLPDNVARLQSLITNPLTRLSLDADRGTGATDLRAALQMFLERNKQKHGAIGEDVLSITKEIRRWTSTKEPLNEGNEWLDALSLGLYDEDRKCINVFEVAHLLGVSLEDLSQMLGQDIDILNAEPTAVSVQMALRPLLSLITRLLDLVGTIDQAQRWLVTPQGALGGRAPIELLRERRFQMVQELILGALFGQMG